MSKTTFVWDPSTDSLLMEVNEPDSSLVVYSQEPAMYGRVLTQRVDDESIWLHFDTFGSTRFCTSHTGAVIATVVTDAWGDIVLSAPLTLPTRLIWGGAWGYYADRIEVTSASVYYARARTYDSLTSRWTAADPRYFVDALNRYLYAINQPTTAFDPTGEDTWTITATGAAGSRPDEPILGPCTPYPNADFSLGSSHFTIRGNDALAICKFLNLKGKDCNVGFLQKTTYTIAVKASSPACGGPNCPSGNASASMCHQHSLERTISFIETFQRESSIALSVEADNHQLYMTSEIVAPLRKHCGQLDTCCPWSVSVSRVKLVTYGVQPTQVGRGTKGVAFNYDDMVTGECFDGLTFSEPGSPRWKPVPRSGPKTVTAVLPDPFLTNAPNQTLDYSWNHPLCGATNAKASWTAYS